MNYVPESAANKTRTAEHVNKSFSSQGVYAGFVYTFAVEAHPTLSHQTAGYLHSIFWAAITAGRLLSIPLSFRIQPMKLLMINLVKQVKR